MKGSPFDKIYYYFIILEIIRKFKKSWFISGKGEGGAAGCCQKGGQAV